MSLLPDLLPQLNALESSGLIQLAQTYPELTYLFQHALIQDAAYSSLTKHSRRQLHRIVGEALEQNYPGQLEELAGLLAHHFARAGERDKAIEYSRRAARRAVATFAYAEAVHHLQTALSLVETEEFVGTRLALLEELGDVRRLLREGVQAIAIYQEALAIFQEIQEDGTLAAIRLHRKIVQTLVDTKWSIDRTHYEIFAQARQDSRNRLESWINLSQGEVPDTEMVRLLRTLSMDSWRNAEPPDWETARRYAQSAVDLAEKLLNPVEMSTALGALATAYMGLGLLREYLQVALRRMAITQDLQFEDIRERIDSLREAGSAMMYLGKYRQALPHLIEAEDLAVRLHAVDQEFNVLALQGQCWFRLDRWDEAFETERKWRALQRTYSREQTGPTCYSVAISAVIHALRGNLETAHSLQQESSGIMISVSGSQNQWLRNQHY
jgi:tetratricopeptide (TPR) repeat protein